MVERDLARSALADESVTRLMTIPGIDTVVPLAVAAAIGDVGLTFYLYAAEGAAIRGSARPEGAGAAGGTPRDLWCARPWGSLVARPLCTTSPRRRSWRGGDQNPEWVTIVLRGIGEMEDSRSTPPDAAKSWIDLSQETDDRGVRRAYVNLVATPNDRQVWAAMDKSAFDLAEKVAGAPANIEYLTPTGWQTTRPQPDAQGRGFWQDIIGSTHHEAGTLFMGDPGSSITDHDGKFHGLANAYVAGPAIFPTLGSANPSLTGLALARKTADAIVKAAAGASAEAGFVPLSLDAKDWVLVKLDQNAAGGFRHHGALLESFGGYGLYFYVKEQLANFVLEADWRVGRRDDNSGIFIRTSGPAVPDPLNAAVVQGHEIQIDERGFDSNTNTEGHPSKRTGAIYDLQAASAFPSHAVGAWNTFEIQANNNEIRVKLNGQEGERLSERSAGGRLPGVAGLQVQLSGAVQESACPAVVGRSRMLGVMGRSWTAGLLKRRPGNVVATALAHNNARAVWALLSRGGSFRPQVVRAAA